MDSATPYITILALISGMLSCVPPPPNFEQLTDEYYLRAIDTRQAMSVYRTLDDGGGIGRIRSTVYAVGWNDSHLIAKQHPGGNRKITGFYILEIAKDNGHSSPAHCVTGPLTTTEFEAKRIELDVDPSLTFTRVLSDLE